ncbi:MAG: Polyketide cyclase/dehydrase [Actinotalea sp.]|nr:Polyketide cyclase/dehydrase [Actinotalea sp.]
MPPLGPRVDPPVGRGVASTSRHLPIPAARAWAVVTDVRNHARWIPFTRIEAASRLRVGDTFAGVTGPAFLRSRGLVDRMVVERLTPPARGRAGVAVYRKLGPVLLGTAEVHVRPVGRTECTVTWVERVHLRGLPARWTRPLLSPVLAGMTSLALRTMAKEQRTRA